MSSNSAELRGLHRLTVPIFLICSVFCLLIISIILSPITAFSSQSDFNERFRGNEREMYGGKAYSVDQFRMDFEQRQRIVNFQTYSDSVSQGFQNQQQDIESGFWTRTKFEPSMIIYSNFASQQSNTLLENVHDTFQKVAFSITSFFADKSLQLQENLPSDISKQTEKPIDTSKMEIRDQKSDPQIEVIKDSQLKVQIEQPKNEPEKIDGEEKILSAVSEKSKGIIVNIGIKPIALLLGGVTSIVKDFFGLVYSAMNSLLDPDRNMVKSLQESSQVLKEDAKEFGLMPFKVLAGVAGYLLGFSPKDSKTHQTSEKLDNWSLWEVYIDDYALREKVRSQVSKDANVAVVCGVGNNMFRDYRGKDGKVLDFKRKQIKDFTVLVTGQKMKTPEEAEQSIKIFKKTNFLAVYTGNVVTDAVLFVFELSGIKVVSEKITKTFANAGVKYYDVMLVHSAGKAVYQNNSDILKAVHIVGIGSPGTYDSSRIQNAELQHNRGDIISNIEIGNSGKQVYAGLRIPIGSNSDEPKYAPWWRIDVNHGYMSYYVRNLPRFKQYSIGGEIND